MKNETKMISGSSGIPTYKKHLIPDTEKIMKADQKRKGKTLLSSGVTSMKTYLKNCCGWNNCDLPEVIKKNLPGYKCVDFLGEGGFGATFMMSKHLRSNIALKVIEGLDETSLDKEDRVLKKMSSSCAKKRILCYDKRFSDGDFTYFVTEYIDGSSMDRHIENKNNDIYKVLAQLIDSVEYIHSKGIVHFDIKPDNVMVTKEGNTKLIDFGGASIRNKKNKVTLSAYTQHFAPPNTQVEYSFEDGKYFDWYTVVTSAMHLIRIMDKIPKDLEYLKKMRKSHISVDISILSHVEKLKKILDTHIQSKSKTFLSKFFKHSTRSILEKKMKSV
jgi:serine/threonine protein kinase